MIKTFFKKLFNKWYIYLPVIIVSAFTVNYYCDFITMPRGSETISVFMATENVIHDALRHYFLRSSPSYLRNVEISFINPSDSMYNEYFAKRGLNHADIFVLPTAKVSEELTTKQFIELDKNYVDSYIECEFDESGTGVLLHRKEDESKQFIEYGQDDYYIYFRKNSIHLGSMNNSKVNTALLITKALIQYEKE